jgi:predicted DNA-binding protein
MWIYNNKVLTEIPKGAVGFVYKITRLNLKENNTKPLFYIGKKGFYQKKRRKKVESDWKEYYGSSELIKEDVKKFGKNNFFREILKICYSKVEMTYYETKYQFDENVLRIDKNSVMPKKYYNSNILGKFYKEKEFAKEETIQVKNYKNNGFEEFAKIPFTDGQKTIFIEMLIEDIDEWLNNNKEWYIGISNEIKNYENKICVSNGKHNYYILKKDLQNFLEDNEDWYIGSKTKGIFKLVINDYGHKKWVAENELEKFLNENNNYRLFNIIKTTNPFIKFNNKIVEFYIRKEDEKYYNEETTNSVPTFENKDFIYNEKDGKFYYLDKTKINQMLDDDTNFKSNFDYSKTEKMVNVINKKTREKVCISDEIYQKNKNLYATPKTKQVKIKSKNRIIFEGYIEIFLEENPNIPKTPLMQKLREGGGKIEFKGKNSHLNDLKIEIKYL